MWETILRSLIAYRAMLMTAETEKMRCSVNSDLRTKFSGGRYYSWGQVSQLIWGSQARSTTATNSLAVSATGALLYPTLTTSTVAESGTLHWQRLRWQNLVPYIDVIHLYVQNAFGLCQHHGEELVQPWLMWPQKKKKESFWNSLNKFILLRLCSSCWFETHWIHKRTGYINPLDT